MEKHETRRSRLREWVVRNGVPQKERSYFSQLLSGTVSFGEKAARRLEDDYAMGLYFLEGGSPPGTRRNASDAKSGPASPALLDGDELIELIALFQQAGPSGRKVILSAARGTSKKLPARREAVRDKR